MQVVRVALLGAETLLGREIQEVLKSRVPGVSVTAYGSNGQGESAEQEEETDFEEPLSGEVIGDHRVLIAAGSQEAANRAYDLVKAGGSSSIIIDCSGHLEQQAEARIVAPLLADSGPAKSWLQVMAHPAASALALALRRLARYRTLSQTVAHVFEPASERGRRGVRELHQQATSLFSFKSLPKDVFDAQLGFNLLAQYGENAPIKLTAVEERIGRHLAAILANGTSSGQSMPSLRLLQAPVFHGYSISLWVKFASAVDAVSLGEALASAQIEVRGVEEEAPNSVGSAAQSGLIAGDIRVDRSDSHAAWIWIVCDNLRVTADGVVDLIGELKADWQ